MDTIPSDCKQILQTKDGPICGYIDQSNERTYYKFRRIPYAMPPIGSLRFNPPYPSDQWTNILDCTQNAPKPLSYVNGEIIGSEDCLYVEVSTPNINPENPLPVMFWIGSTFFAMYLDHLYDPALIINQNIVFVRCGFRLGPFGFLSINDFTAPGNSGLKDIVMALQWVQKNISSFGGDPENVTIFGNSTGGTIIHLLMMSSLATGLFHKAIIQNSSSLNRWSIDKNPVQSMMNLARKLGITKTDKWEVLEELKTVAAKDIVEATNILYMQRIKSEQLEMFDTIFKPIIEEEFEGQVFFINKSPELIIKSGNYNKVPMIIGSNNIPTSLLEYINADMFVNFENFTKNSALMIPKPLAFIDDIAAKRVGQHLIDYFLKGRSREHDKTHILEMFTDYHYIFPINRTVKIHSQVAPDYPIYYYIINFAGEWSDSAKFKSTNIGGQHAEIPYLFLVQSHDSSIFEGSLDSIIIRKKIIKMWTNFAKFGNPTPDEDDPDLQITWDPIANENKLNYLSIGHEITKGRNPFHDRMKFWDELLVDSALLKALLYFNDGGISWHALAE